MNPFVKSAGEILQLNMDHFDLKLPGDFYDGENSSGRKAFNFILRSDSASIVFRNLVILKMGVPEAGQLKCFRAEDHDGEEVLLFPTHEEDVFWEYLREKNSEK